MGKVIHVFRVDRFNELQGERTLQEFSDSLGIGQSQVAKYLKGKSEPSPMVLVQIAKAAKVSTDWLLGISDDTHFQPGELSEFEKRVLMAWRTGNLKEMFKLGAQRPELGTSERELPVE